jgi:uncharacterized protein
VKYVLVYTAAPDVAERAPGHFPAHQELLTEFHGRGELLMVGTFTDVRRHGSMAIFTTAEAARAFVARDPFVAHGVVTDHDIREWNEVLA